jgi:hypothetical protein
MANQTESQPAGEETQEISELEKLRSELETEKKTRMAAEAKTKDLGSRLTRAQQLAAEYQNFHTETLPAVNRMAKKSFVDQWDEAPEVAVHQKVQEQVDPINFKIAQANAAAWMAQILAANPKWAIYEDRVIDLGEEFKPLTYSRDGIKKLFQMARSEDTEKELENLRSSNKVNEEKSRTVTESPNASGATRSESTQVRLTPIQRRVAENLGLTPEQYAKRIPQVKSIGEVEDV